VFLTAARDRGYTLGMCIDDLFSYHAPRGDQPDRYAKLRTAAKEFALAIEANTKPGPDQSAAIRKVREAVMTANASIALESCAEDRG
jgi:hypothetical protein